jgi:hypothetical protein
MDFVLFGSGAALTALAGYCALLVLERFLLRGSTAPRRPPEDQGWL